MSPDQPPAETPSPAGQLPLLSLPDDWEGFSPHRGSAALTGASGMTMTRCHGDFHLGQVLIAGDDVVIIDFEGEPGRTLAQRRAKQSPWRDVAGLLRSLSYARYSALRLAPPADPVTAAQRQARCRQPADFPAA